MKHDDSKEEETPIEWKDPLETHKYVCEGAKVQCMFCASPGTLKATSTKIKLQDKPFITAGDKDGKVNFNFQGPCMHPSQQKPNAPPPPCKSIISLGQWTNTSKTFIGNERALVVGSMITCSISGAPIRIIHSGQKATLENFFKMDSPVMGMAFKEKEPKETSSESSGESSTLSVTSVRGKTRALPFEKVKYKVTGYNLTDVSEGDRNRVKWVILVDGEKEYRSEEGEVLDMVMKEEWAGKEISVIPYLSTENISVNVKTQVRIEAIVVFVNGYWNSGKTDSLAEPLKKMLAEKLIGTKNKREYWSDKFIKNTYDYFICKHLQWCDITIQEDDITPIFIDGSNVWNSSGQTRFNAGWDEAENLLKTDLLTNNVINNEGAQMKKIFVISHSMGGAHAEGMIAAWKSHNLEIEYVLHFSAADNKDFQVKLPHITYQINLVPDIVLAYKNTDDRNKVLWENFWNMIKRPYLPRPDVYMIERMLPDHFIEITNYDKMNHAYTKRSKVWDLVPFLKNDL